MSVEKCFAEGVRVFEQNPLPVFFREDSSLPETLVQVPHLVGTVIRPDDLTGISLVSLDVPVKIFDSSGRIEQLSTVRLHNHGLELLFDRPSLEEIQ